MGNAFDAATTVAAAGDGRYAASLDERWNLAPLPQGGIVVGAALRAMAAELGDPGQPLRLLHALFVAQVAHGELEIDVEVLRRGRSMSHARAEVRNAGERRGHLVTAAFGARREGYDFTDVRPPAVAPPGDCPSFRDPPPPGWEMQPRPFWDEMVDARRAIGLQPWDPTPRSSSEQAIWYRFEDTPWLDDGTLDPLAVVVLADTMPGAVGQRIGATDRQWFAPSVDLTVHLLNPCRSEWLLGHNTARFAGDGYASAEMALWDLAGPDPVLVAYATQLFLFTFP